MFSIVYSNESAGLCLYDYYFYEDKHVWTRIIEVQVSRY